MERAPLFAELNSSLSAAYWTPASDGVMLRTAVWESASPSKGTVFLFPGRTEYIEKLAPVAAEFNKRGFSGIVIDWRGQGLSDRLTENRLVSHVLRFSDYQIDVAAVVKAAEDLELPRPWYLLGHSMGACIGLRAVLEALPVEACAFTGPLWDIKLSSVERAVAWPITWVSQGIGKGDVFAPGNNPQRKQCYVLSVGFDGNRLTSDPTMFQYMVTQAKALPDHQTGAPSMGWVYEALKECRSLARMKSPRQRCVTFCGDLDVVVDIDAVQMRMEAWPGGKLEMISNAKHDILSERPEVRGRVLEQVCKLFSDS
jgi:lysophospholipase